MIQNDWHAENMIYDGWIYADDDSEDEENDDKVDNDDVIKNASDG